MTICRQDIQQLVREPSAEVRAGIAAKVSHGFNRSHFTETESRIAIDIFRLLLRDTAVLVRKSIAAELKHNEFVPHDIIRALAFDSPEIAVTVLEHSVVLTDDDLVELLEATRHIDKWLAVSRRKHLSPRLSRALIATDNHQVVSSLLGNGGAEIDEDDIEEIAERFRGDRSVMEALMCRGGLSAPFAEKLFTLVSDQFRRQLTRRYRLSWAVAGKASDTAREMGVLRFMIPWMSRQETEALVRHMCRNKRLHYSLVLRSLCLGEVHFFEASLAALAGIPIENARTLMLDAGPLGFTALYKKCGLPAELSEAAKALYRLTLLETNDGKSVAPDYMRRMIDRIMANGYHETVESMPYLISMMRQQIHEPATIH